MVSTKNILFLDIDGVLATYKEYATDTTKLWEKNSLAKELRLHYKFNDKCVRTLNRILTETGAEIVLSSDWRNHYDLEKLDIIFKFNGVIKSPIDVTDNFSLATQLLERARGAEIMSYVENNKLKNYVVLDDLDLKFYVPQHRFLMTNDRQGINIGTPDDMIKKVLLMFKNTD
jgi:hypothetical protein